MNSIKILFSGCLLTVITACNEPDDTGSQNHLVVNEVVSSNDGVAIDETGQPEDWIELTNTGTTAINLRDYAIADSGSSFIPLPDVALAPGAFIQLWADDDPDRGANHLPFKLSASGDKVILQNRDGKVVQQIDLPALETNQSYSRFPSGSGDFARCRYATPGKSNGVQCGPNAVPPLENDVTFEAFPAAQWPPLAPAGLGINELAILPARFIEFKNFSATTINTADYRLVLAAYPPTSGLPVFDSAVAIDLPSLNLAPGDVFAVDLTEAQVAAINQQALNEGVAVLFARQTQEPVDTVPFMHWPQNRALTRAAAHPFRLRFCDNETPNLDGECQHTPLRDISNRTRGLYTPTDFARLAAGSGQSSEQSVKFVIDLDHQNAVHFLGARDWPLHYTFVREVIDMDPPLNRCDTLENQLFNQGWSRFSIENYNSSINRRYHLGTLTHHPRADMRNVEFTFGDAIAANQMRDAFFTVTALTEQPLRWSLRPQDAQQVTRVRAIEGTLPIVGPKAPYANIVFQGLTPGVAYAP